MKLFRRARRLWQERRTCFAPALPLPPLCMATPSSSFIFQKDQVLEKLDVFPPERVLSAFTVQPPLLSAYTTSRTSPGRTLPLPVQAVQLAISRISKLASLSSLFVRIDLQWCGLQPSKQVSFSLSAFQIPGFSPMRGGIREDRFFPDRHARGPSAPFTSPNSPPSLVFLTLCLQTSKELGLENPPRRV